MFDKLVKIYDEFTKGDRVQELDQLAQEESLTLKKRESFSKQSTILKSFKIFSGKGTKRFLGILSFPTHSIQGKIRFYDYLKTKDLETKSHSIIEIYVDRFDIDYLAIEPKGPLKKMKNLFLQANFPFPELKEFHKIYEVSADEEEDLFLLKRSALQLLARNPGITLEAMGNYFIFYFHGKTIEVQDIVSTIHLAEEFVKLLFFDETDYFV